MAVAPGYLRRASWLVALGLLTANCGSRPVPQQIVQVSGPDWTQVALRPDTSRVVDATRHRAIPLIAYAPVDAVPKVKLKVALLNHAYHGKNTEYLFVAKNLVAHGYYVVSLQHELPGDEPIAMTGNLR